MKNSVITRIKGGFNFSEMRNSEMCSLLENLIKEINIRKTLPLDKNGRVIMPNDILRTTLNTFGTFIIEDNKQFAIKSPGSNAIDYEDTAFFNSCEIVSNITTCPYFYDMLLDDCSACFNIKNFEINVPDFQYTKKIMHEYMDSIMENYSENKDFLCNLTEMLQEGFGVQLGFCDKDVKIEVCQND